MAIYVRHSQEFFRKTSLIFPIYQIKKFLIKEKVSDFNNNMKPVKLLLIYIKQNNNRQIMFKILSLLRILRITKGQKLCYKKLIQF